MKIKPRPEASHPFERAGLGRPPYTFLGCDYLVGPIRFTDPKTGVDVQVGSPGQPMGCCDYCSQGIANVFRLRSADGNLFKVGCDCIRKSGDAGLDRQVEPTLRAQKREQRQRTVAREQERMRVALRMIQASPALRARMGARPSPNARRPDDTLLDWAVWMLTNAGHAGSLKATRAVEAEVCAATAEGAKIEIV